MGSVGCFGQIENIKRQFLIKHLQIRAKTRRNTSNHVLTISITSSPCCDLDTTSYLECLSPPISKRRRLRIFNLSVRTRLSTDKIIIYSTCPENATFPRTKCLNAVFTPRVQSAHTHRGRRTSVHGLWRQFPRLWHNLGLRHRYRNSYSPRHQACRAGWTGARWCGS